MKAVFFDFDGTLTCKSPNIWKSIWEELGYDTGAGSEYKSQLDAFLNGDITNFEWCDETLECYIDRNMNVDVLKNVSKNIQLIQGASETFKALKEKGYELHIISGNIIEVIKKVLGKNIKYFTSINANDFIFDKNNKLTFIKGTEYDCEGKAKFIQEYILKTNANPNELYFIGNGFNDEWAYLSGCNTICINPEETEHTNSNKWHQVIYNLTDLKEILKFVK